MIKSTFKFALSALLLAASGSAFAEQAKSVIKLANVEDPVTWEAFVDAFTNPGSLVDPSLSQAVTETDAAVKALPSTASLQAALERAQAEQTAAQTNVTNLTNRLAELRDDRSTLDPKKEDNVVGWLETIIENANSYLEDWNEYSLNGTDANNTIYYIMHTGVNGWGEQTKILYLSFSKETPATKPSATTLSWSKATDMIQFRDALGTAKYNEDGTLASFTATTLTAAYVYLGAGLETTDGKAAISQVQISESSLSLRSIIQGAVTALETQSTKEGYHSVEYTTAYKNLTNQINAIAGTKDENGNVVTKGSLAEAQETLDAKVAAVNAAQNAVTAAPGKLADAQKAYNDAVAAYNTAVSNVETSLNNVSITGDFTASKTITKKYTGHISGGNHVVTIPSGVLFSSFAGTLDNTAINGTLATSTSGASFSHVAVWTGEEARYYGENATSATTCESFEELGMAVRAYFGVNLETTQLAPLGENNVNKLYNITVYNPEDGEGTQYYAQKTVGNSFVYGSELSEVETKANSFIESKTSDIASLTNVIYNGICKNVFITDREAFFCPKAITAEKVEYSRILSKTSVICLPFALDPSKYEGIATIGSYDQEAGGKFWFKNTTKTLPANTPALVVLEDGVSVTLTGEGVTKIAATPAPEMYVAADSQGNDGSIAYGLLSTFTCNDFKEGTQGTVFALTKNGTFNPVENNKITLPSLRVVMYSPGATKISAPRTIGILDEWGVDITEQVLGTNTNIETGIEEVEENVASLTIEGGLGEIIFTSDVEYGKVVVYSLDGKVAAVTNVVPGTTTVNVKNGLYIVNGKKILVK